MKFYLLSALLCVNFAMRAHAEVGTRENPALNEEYPVEGEDVVAKRLGTTIQNIQNENAKDNNGKVERGFHSKVHGCVRAKFIIHDVPEIAKHGLFAKPDEFEAWIRFTNGKGTSGRDADDDARGAAIKVMGVNRVENAKKLLDTTKGALTQDFLMTNQPSQIVPTAKEFTEFAEAVHTGPLGIGAFFLKYPHAFTLFNRYMRRGIESVATEDYWSGTPYGLVDKEGNKQAVKFMIKNSDEGPSKSPLNLLKSANYLGEDLKWRVKHGVTKDGVKGPIEYKFYLQFQKDPRNMPVEEADVVWDENVSKPIHVATLRIDPQTFDSPVQKAYCDSLVFNPWHGLDSFVPMGSMNRARKTIYQMSSDNKNNFVATSEPSGFKDFDNFFSEFVDKGAKTISGFHPLLKKLVDQLRH